MRRVYSKIRRGILRIYKYYDKYRNVRNYFVVACVLSSSIERILT